MRSLRSLLLSLASGLATVPITLVGLVLLTFVIGRVVPIDPVLAVVGDRAPQAVVERTRHELGLDRPLPVQFALYVGQLARGNLGRSTLTGNAVTADIARVLGADPDHVEAIRQRMMAFDPAGMFARSLAECLAAQLRERNRLDPAMVALLENLELLARRDMRTLLDVCEVDWDDLQEMVGEIRELDPKPGANWDSAPLPAVIPDVLMRAAPGGDWLLELNPDTMPRILVNEAFYARISRDPVRDTRAFASERLATANWLVKSLQQRAQTILKVASEIVRRQDGFFRHGVSHLRPLILRDIAEEVTLHESTVSRVTANKFIATPRGIFELKYFFTTAIAGAGGESHSAEAVRHRIRAMVAAETVADILSDDAIVAILKREGIDIARRTVAKYRDALRIPSSVQRKREKAMQAAPASLATA